MGFAGAPDKKAAEAWNKYIIIDMYAQAASGKMKRRGLGQVGRGRAAQDLRLIARP